MFKKIALLITSGLFAIISVSAINDPAGGRGVALGNASVALTDAFAAQNNQAATGFLKNIMFGVHSENKFLIQGLTSAGALAVIPTATGTFSCNFNYFGYDLYNEIKAGMGYGKALTKNFSIGAQFTFLSINLAEYGSATAFTVEGGILYKPMPKLSIGAHIFNPVNASLGEHEELLPVVFKLGGAYNASEKILIVAEAEKDMLKPVILKSGLEYKMNDSFLIRTGLQDLTQMSFGIGINTNNFSIDMAAAYHQVLGFSPSFSLAYELKRS